MKTIALTAAALLVAAGGAFAHGSDHYGSQDTLPQASTADSGYTSSIVRKHVTKTHEDNAQNRATNKIQPQFEH